MVRVNLIEPKGDWFPIQKWRGLFTIFYRPKGQMFQTIIRIHLWSGTSSSFYTAKKVQKVIYYQPN